MGYWLWWVKRYCRYASKGLGQRANNWTLVGGAVVGLGADALGIRMIPSEGWQGTLINGVIGLAAAWVLVLVIQLVRAPFRMWEDGKWHDGEFAYHEPKLATSITVTPADNNKPHAFKFTDAPPNAYIHYKIEIDPPGASYINVDVRCIPQQLQQRQEWSIQQHSSGAVRTNARHALCLTTFMRAAATPRQVRIYVMSWKKAVTSPAST